MPITICLIIFGNIFRNDFSWITFIVLSILSLISLKLHKSLTDALEKKKKENPTNNNNSN